MLKDLKMPQAIVICVVFLGTLAGIWAFAREGMDPTPAVVLGTTVLAGLGIGQIVAQQREIKEQTNGTATAQMATIRHLAAMAAVSAPTPEMQALATQLVSTPNPVPSVPVPRDSEAG